MSVRPVARSVLHAAALSVGFAVLATAAAHAAEVRPELARQEHARLEHAHQGHAKAQPVRPDACPPSDDAGTRSDKPGSREQHRGTLQSDRAFVRDLPPKSKTREPRHDCRTTIEGHREEAIRGLEHGFIVPGAAARSPKDGHMKPRFDSPASCQKMTRPAARGPKRTGDERTPGARDWNQDGSNQRWT